jgi:hypothetical protein
MLKDFDGVAAILQVKRVIEEDKVLFGHGRQESEGADN